MRIGQNYSIQQTQELAQRRDQQARVSSFRLNDVVALKSAQHDARAADMDVQQTQNTMTLFRVAGGALSRVEGAVRRMVDLAGEAASGSLSSAEINMAATEMNELESVIDFAVRGATMGGVPVFGSAPETEAMWKVAIGNAAALGTNEEGSDIGGVPVMSAKSLGVEGLRLSDGDALQKARSAAVRTAYSRELMDRQADRMGDAALELTMAALDQMTAAVRSGRSSTNQTLAAFVLDNAPESLAPAEA